MGFGKFLGGALCAVGAVIAAPIVLPALAATAVGAAAVGTAAVAAAGTAAAGVATAVGATAVGTAAAGVATAVGTAAAGVATAVGATAVGTAAAGVATAVGTAAVGAAGVVGTTVATAAGAVGLSSVAAIAGTGAGAAALGTITTAGAVGIGTGVSGVKKISEASEIKGSAQYRYEKKRDEFDKIEQETNNSLEKLGELKISIWGSFDRFIHMFEKIQNKPEIMGEASKETIHLTKDELKNIKGVAFSVKDMMIGGTVAMSTGTLIGMATSGSIVSTITVASTGTAITSLSGVAATNATLAALGGGSLATGGAGMAGGTAILGGLTFAPMIAIGGIMLNSKGKKSLETAYNISNEADKTISKMNDSEKELKKVNALSDSVTKELTSLNVVYLKLLTHMEKIVSVKINYNAFTQNEKKKLEKTVLAVKLLKNLSMEDILDSKNDNAVLDKEVKTTIQKVKEQSKQLLID